MTYDARILGGGAFSLRRERELVSRILLALAALLVPLAASGERIYWNDELASTLLGAEVVNHRGERLGEVRDLVIDLRSEQVPAVLVQSGGFLGLFEEVRAFPLSWFAPGRADRVVLDIPAADMARVRQQPSPYLPRASDLVGSEVRDRHGAVVGELRDLVVNLRDGRVRHAVLALATPERQVTIAARLLSARADALVVHMNFAELQALVSP